MPKKPFIAVLALSLLGCWLSFPALPALACTIGGGDPWFINDIRLDQASLPSGVTVDYSVASHIRLNNSSSTPLYLVDYFTNSATFQNTELPSMVRPLYKLVQGKVYDYDYSSNSYSLYSSQPLSIGWEDLARLGVTAHSQNPIEDNRPDNVAVPADQHFSFTAYSGSAPVLITGSAHYTLNSNYDPHAESKAGQLCSRLNSENLIIFVVLPLVIVLVLIWLLLRKGKRAGTRG